MPCCPKNVLQAIPNGAVGLSQAVVAKVTGAGAARPETVLDREAICGPCEWLRLGGKVCGACFCLLPAKRSLAEAECCRGKWGREVNEPPKN